MSSGSSAQIERRRDSAGIAIPVLRSGLRVLTLAIFLVLTFRVLQYLPQGSWTRELAVVTLGAMYLLLYLPERLAVGVILSKVEAYVSMLMLIPLFSAFAAWRVFGQPLSFGILAERGIVLVAVAPLILLALRRKVIFVGDLEKALLLLGWTSLLAFSVVTLFVDPSNYLEYGRGLVEGGIVEAPKFKLDTTFLVFGFMYYALCITDKQQRWKAGLALPFLVYLVLGAGGRFQLLSLLGAYVFLIVRGCSIKQTIVYMVIGIVASTALMASLYLVAGEALAELGTRFVAAFKVVLTGELGDDASANARILEWLIVAPYILENWLFGNGELSHQWEGGYESRFDYFYPSDIGIVGALYTYGIVGTIVFGYQFVLAYKVSSPVVTSTWKWKRLERASIGFLLYFAFYSLSTGMFVHSPEVNLFFIAIAYWLSLQRVDMLHVEFGVKPNDERNSGSEKGHDA